MDIAAILNLKALAVGLAAALPLLLIAALLPTRLDRSPLWQRVRGAAYPLALAAGFVAAFAMQFDFPLAKNGVPWYLDEVWKLSVIAAGLAGLGVAVVAILPRLAGAALVVLLAGVLVLLTVRGPWVASADRPAWVAWPWFAAALGAALLAWLVGLGPSAREPKLWLVGTLPLWATSTAAAIMLMTWLDQRLGRLLIMLAILAGLAAVTGILRRLRPLIGRGCQFLALLLGVLGLLAGYYNSRLDQPPLPAVSLALLAFGPLGAAAAWIPALRRRPWACTGLAAAATAAVLIPALLITAKFAPPLPE